MFKIHEFSSASGGLSPVYLRVKGNADARTASEDGEDREAGAERELEIVSEDGVWPLPDTALHAVLSRFGSPFDEEATVSTVATLELPSGERLRHVRHLAGYDVIARDYIVYQPRPASADDGVIAGEALCALSATVAAALLHLGRAAAGSVRVV